MSLARGLQSAIFHYLSCAPCLDARRRHKTKRQAKHDRKARQVLYLEQPDLYRHPDPSATNEHWQEEIEKGPAPRRKKKKSSQEASQREKCVVSRAGTDASLDSRHGTRDGTPVTEKAPRLSEELLDDDNWNRRRYQREDEELWGSGFGEPEPTSLRRTPYGMKAVGGRARPGTSNSSASSWSLLRAPVNDLHPPIVTMLSKNPADSQWMLQPPPRAAIMAGKERINSRSRSGSGASSRVELNGRTSQRSLRQQLSTRRLAKIDSDDMPNMPPPVSRGSSSTTTARSARARRLEVDTSKANIAFQPPTANLQVDAKKQLRERKDSSMDEGHAPTSGSESIPMTSSTLSKTSPELHTPAPMSAVSKSSSSGFQRVISIPNAPTLLSPARSASSDTGLSLRSFASRQASRENQHRHSIAATDGTDSPGSEDGTDSSSASDKLGFMRRRTPILPGLKSLGEVKMEIGRRGSKTSRRKNTIPKSEERDASHFRVSDRGNVAEQWAGSGFGMSRDWEKIAGTEDWRKPTERWSMEV